MRNGICNNQGGKSNPVSYNWTSFLCCSCKNVDIKGQLKCCGYSIYSSLGKVWLVGYFRLFIVATGFPSVQHLQKTVSCNGGIVQGYRKKLLRAPPGSVTAWCIAPSHGTSI